MITKRLLLRARGHQPTRTPSPSIFVGLTNVITLGPMVEYVQVMAHVVRIVLLEDEACSSTTARSHPVFTCI